MGMGKALLRLAAGGLLCGGALSLGGTGARRELVRFCSACVMLILVMTTLQNTSLPQLSYAEQQNVLEQTAEDARLQTLQEVLRQTEADLSREVERLAALENIQCEAHVTCNQQEGLVTVETVELWLASPMPSSLSHFIDTLRQQLNVTQEQIIIREAMQ